MRIAGIHYYQSNIKELLGDNELVYTTGFIQGVERDIFVRGLKIGNIPKEIIVDTLEIDVVLKHYNFSNSFEICEGYTGWFEKLGRHSKN